MISWRRNFKLAERLNTLIDKVVDEFKKFVDTVATGLKAAIDKIADSTKAVLNAAMDLYAAAVDIGLSLLKGVLTGNFSDFIDKALNAVLKIAGISREEFDQIFGKAKETIQLIVENPKTFIDNVIAAGKGGFEKFRDNFGSHFQSGILEWMTGSVNDLTIPDKFDAEGVFTMATELLGLTKDWLIEKAERLIGKENVELIGKVKENVDIYMKDGWSGLWDEHISKNLQGIAGIVVDSITGWIEKKVVIEAVKYIISLFNPVAALLKAIQMGWNIYTFIKENFTKMMNLVSAFTNELANIAQGNVSNAINFVESALAKGLTLGIKLLAKLLNIDKVARGQRSTTKDS